LVGQRKNKKVETQYVSIEDTRQLLWQTVNELAEGWPDLRPEGMDLAVHEPRPFKHLTMGLLLLDLAADMVLLAHEVVMARRTPPAFEHVEARRETLRAELREAMAKWLSKHGNPMMS
jgi:hypothetical protein